MSEVPPRKVINSADITLPEFPTRDFREGHAGGWESYQSMDSSSD
jgi:hypothetical protein